MNLLLFDSQQPSYQLTFADPRARHIATVLRMQAGDTLAVGVTQGPRGQATIVRLDAQGIQLAVSWSEERTPLYPVALLIGLPRPQTARKILQSCSTMGINQLHFFIGDKSDPAYAQSRLWHSNQWRRHLRLGAEQGCATSLPEVIHNTSLRTAVQAIEGENSRIALDIYEAPRPLSQAVQQTNQTVLAVGPERGWSAAERYYLRQAGFAFGHLGPRVLRTEYACIAAISIVLAQQGVC